MEGRPGSKDNELAFNLLDEGLSLLSSLLLSGQIADIEEVFEERLHEGIVRNGA